MKFSNTEHVTAQWRARALERSLEAARARSVDRIERLVAAARDLANETGSAAFTVTQVTEAAGLSLKSFYRCFAGKDDLLLALLEEDSRIGADLLADLINRHRDPVDRLAAYVRELFGMLTHPGAVGYAGVLVREHRRLSEDRFDDLRVALSPLTGLLAAEIRAAVALGVVPEQDAERTAEMVFGLLLAGIHEVTLGRAEPMEEAERVWRFCWGGISGSGGRRGGRLRGDTRSRR
jgi:AcrR family transcriptional regulator